jgi:agmatine deiminase
VKQTPASLGYRFPAEWETHGATWIGWPHNASDWPGRSAPIPWVYGEIVRRIAPGEIVRILVNSAAHETRARRLLAKVGVEASRVEFLRMPTNRGWTRDFGPLFLRKDGPAPELAIARFRFNGWAKYPDWKKDDRIPELASRRLGLPAFTPTVHGRGVVLEGGSIDGNGLGSVLTTEECLLDSTVQPRNPGLSRTELETVLRDYLGATNVLWLGRGIVGDDTHGHVDDVCRFVGPRTVVVCEETNPADPNYRPLAENRERLAGMRVADGSSLEIVELPMPAPVWFAGRRLPASYANFYVGTGAVLVPTFNDPSDRVALGILAELFPRRTVVGIHSTDFVLGLGTIHCSTQQEPLV